LVAAGGLVDEHPPVGQREALARRTGGEDRLTEEDDSRPRPRRWAIAIERMTAVGTRWHERLAALGAAVGQAKHADRTR